MYAKWWEKLHKIWVERKWWQWSDDDDDDDDDDNDDDCGTVEPRYNEPCYSEDPVTMNNIWKPGRITVKYMETNPAMTKSPL